METAYKILWGAAKAVILRWTFIAMNTYIKKIEKSQINNLTLLFKKLEKEERTNKAQS